MIKIKIIFAFPVLMLSLYSLVFSSPAMSEAITDKIKPPFGIRNYDVGMAADFSLPDIDGEMFQLKSVKGQWVFLHFWASWCGPCKKEMPVIQVLSEKMQSKSFKIVMINMAESEDTVFEFLASIGVELNSLLDKDGQVTEVWKPRGLPTTFIINPKGEIKYQAIGGRDWGKPEYIDFLKALINNSK